MIKTIGYWDYNYGFLGKQTFKTGMYCSNLYLQNPYAAGTSEAESYATEIYALIGSGTNYTTSNYYWNYPIYIIIINDFPTALMPPSAGNNSWNTWYVSELDTNKKTISLYNKVGTITSIQYTNSIIYPPNSTKECYINGTYSSTGISNNFNETNTFTSSVIPASSDTLQLIIFFTPGLNSETITVNTITGSNGPLLASNYLAGSNGIANYVNIVGCSPANYTGSPIYLPIFGFGIEGTNYNSTTTMQSLLGTDYAYNCCPIISTISDSIYRSSTLPPINSYNYTSDIILINGTLQFKGIV